MYITRVMTGKIIEIHDDRVLTQQGDAICTYHSRYYRLPDIETELEVDYGSEDIEEQEHSGARYPLGAETLKPGYL